MARIRSAIGASGAVALLAAVFSGCTAGGDDKPTVHLQGTVTIAGKPVPSDADAMIVFSPLDATQSRSASSRITDGKFDVPDAPRGKIKAMFTINQPTGKMIQFDKADRPYPETKSLVPESKSQGLDIQADVDQSDMKIDL